jgi:hypothetical protein
MSDLRGTLQNLRDVMAELVVQPLLGWLAGGKGTQMDGGTMDRAALTDWWSGRLERQAETEDCLGAGCGDCPGCWDVDASSEQDPAGWGATDGVDPRTGVPLEQSGVNVRLAP